MKLNKILLDNRKTKEIIKLINNKNSIKISGLNNSRLAFFIGSIYEKINNTILLITYDSYKINKLYEDLIRLIPAGEILIFPKIEVLPHEQIIPDYLVIKDRLTVMQNLVFNSNYKIIITSAGAIMRKLMPAKLFKKHSRILKPGQEIDFKKLTKDLHLLG